MVAMLAGCGGGDSRGSSVFTQSTIHAANKTLLARAMCLVARPCTHEAPQAQKAQAARCDVC
jgi:hypothetical protein